MEVLVQVVTLTRVTGRICTHMIKLYIAGLTVPAKPGINYIYSYYTAKCAHLVHVPITACRISSN